MIISELNFEITEKEVFSMDVVKKAPIYLYLKKTAIFFNYLS